MGLWSRHKSHSQCNSHSLLQQQHQEILRPRARSWKKSIWNCSPTFPEHCGKHTDLTWDRGEHKGSLSRANPRDKGREWGAAEWLPMPLYSGGMSTRFTGVTEDPIHWAAAAEGPKGEESESLQLRDFLASSLVLWILETEQKGASW